MTRFLSLILALFWASSLSAKTDIQTVTSDAGHAVWLVSEPTIPIVSVVLNFGGGAVTDPDDAQGATNLMTGLLEEGAGDMSAQDFAMARESLASRITFDSGRESVWVTITSLKENLPQTLQLVKTALTKPRFDPDAVERVRQQVLSSLRYSSTRPNDIASKAFFEAAFSAHPYARPSEGSIESVSALRTEDLRESHARNLTTGALTIAAVGDIDAATLLPLLDGLLADLPSAGPSPAAPTTVNFDTPVQTLPLNGPQSVALFGHEGIARENPDFYAAYILNHIVGGGGFSSRLTQEIRVARGLTYGVSTFLVGFDEANLIMGSVASSNDRIAESIALVRQIWADVAENGVTEAELTAAKSYLTGAYALRFDSNAKIANILIGLQLNDLGPDYINIRNDLISAVTLADINRVAKQLLQPEALHFTVVGQPEGL